MNELAQIEQLERETMNMPYTGETEQQMGDQLPRVEEIGKCSLFLEALPGRSKSVFSFCPDLLSDN